MLSDARKKSPHRLWRGLLLAAGVALCGQLLFVGDGLVRLEYLLYDTMVRVHQRPANDRIVIVGIDEKSLRELGRWPWSRSVHATLLDRLSDYGAEIVGIDILLAEQGPGIGQQDVELARAIERHGGVVLVVGPKASPGQGPVAELLPLPAFAIAADKLSHIDFEMDSDGICRRVFLRAGAGEPHWPAFAMALAQALDPASIIDIEDDYAPADVAGTGWVRASPILIPYAGPPGHFDRLSYVDVLRGRVSKEQLQGRVVLVGATAVGLGDNLSTPLSDLHTLMPGVEVNANVTATLLEGLSLTESGAGSRAVFTATSVLTLLLCLLFLPGRWGLAAYLFAATVTLLLSLWLLYFSRTWLPPALPVLLQTMLYIVWAWLDLGQLSRASKILYSQIYRQARLDRITGLPNKVGLEDRLDKMTQGRGARQLGLLLISLSGQRAVIDQAGLSGHAAVQREIAARLGGAAPRSGSVYRLDGGEFALLIAQRCNREQLERLATRVVQSLLRPFEVEGGSFSLNPSIGASTGPAGGNATQRMIEEAHTAMNQAKSDRVRSFRFYSSRLRANVAKQATIQQGLRDPALGNELRCVYQPQVSLQSGLVTGVETLVRWQHPRLGEIPPQEFIPLAEREGLIVPVGNWILKQACLQGQTWRIDHGLDLRIGVNVSAVQLESAGLRDAVSNALTESGLPPASLELELTESALLSHHESAATVLAEIKQLGVELAIDDFGTGYSSLTYLKNFPIDRIKIDQSFVVDVHESAESAAIVRSIVAMAHQLDLESIAEGIERRVHMDFLREVGCDEAQGHFIGMPMSAEEIEVFASYSQSQLLYK